MDGSLCRKSDIGTSHSLLIVLLSGPAGVDPATAEHGTLLYRVPLSCACCQRAICRVPYMRKEISLEKWRNSKKGGPKAASSNYSEGQVLFLSDEVYVRSIVIDHDCSRREAISLGRDCDYVGLAGFDTVKLVVAKCTGRHAAAVAL